MKSTVRNDTTERRTPSIEETVYGPPQHSTRRADPEMTFYGVPQHETDVVVDAEPRESPAYRYRWKVESHRDRLQFGPGPTTEVIFP
ncbi:hypothetical protein A4G99_17495 [Haladaptatus sp. R4]|uniref:hypothetical protein n=1 Tax=Haladaptatus sp. R4 TaxID=1679489 RepID=UPI0007B4D631|nr:hypothetical protein [Haladaptatus sp. R4]KZN22891.1 hypothetical protein A4G99_17495 [Haladaptatus sp. R4]